MKAYSKNIIRGRKVEVNRIELIDSFLFVGLEHEELDKLVEVVLPVEVKFKKGDVLWREGNLVDGLGLLEKGTLFCHRYHSDGKIQLMRIYAPKDIINAEAAVSRRRTSPTFVVASSSGNYIWFPNSNLFDNPLVEPKTICKIQANLLTYLASDMIRFMKKSDILSRRTVRDRIIMYLDVLREKHGNAVNIGMNQEELAQFLCVDRSSLSEELNKMRREGLIDFNRKTYQLFFD
jgi:cAMP-binding proteins - catabolite gene activator and regulatory subunit of cAMP-dependent protein kinases